MKVAEILRGKDRLSHRQPDNFPGSRQVLDMMAQNGALSDIIASGARILECACGPLHRNGTIPNSAGISLRTFNRNFEGRSGTADAKVYLVSP